VTGAVAQLHLPILPTLDRAGTVAIELVHIQDVLVGETTIPLMDAGLADLFIVLNVALRDVTPKK